MHSLTFMEIVKLSIVIPPLLVLSVICIGVMFERMIFFLRYARVNQRMLDRIRTFVKAGKMNEARNEALRAGGLIPEAIAAQIEAVNLPRNERESLVLFYHQRLQSLLQKRLWIFGTLGFICPFVGLL